MTIFFSEPLDEDAVGGIFRVSTSITIARGTSQCPGSNTTITAEPREVYVSGNTAVVVGLGKLRKNTGERGSGQHGINFEYTSGLIAADSQSSQWPPRVSRTWPATR